MSLSGSTVIIENDLLSAVTEKSAYLTKHD